MRTHDTAANANTATIHTFFMLIVFFQFFHTRPAGGPYKSALRLRKDSGSRNPRSPLPPATDESLSVRELVHRAGQILVRLPVARHPSPQPGQTRWK